MNCIKHVKRSMSKYMQISMLVSLYAYVVVISSLQPSSHLMSILTLFDQVNVLLHKKHFDATILSKIKHQTEM